MMTIDRSLPKNKTTSQIPLKRTRIEQGVLIFVILIMAILAGVAAYLFTRQIAQYGLSAIGIIPPAINSSETDSSGLIEPDQLSDLPPQSDLSQSIIPQELTPWNGAGRVTLLLMGLDYRDWSSKKDYSRSDTMILLTLDPLTRTAGMLSIPRDMWAPIPGFEHGKINTAYFLGEAYKLPGGGPGLAVKTVEEFLGVPINYYAQVDFNAFVRFIDEIGGVKINVPQKITVDLLGSGSETKKTLKPGTQVLPGEWALAYARNRSTGEGDFDRARRQQQVILAIRDRILSFDMLPILISKAPTLFKELSDGIDTNLKLNEVLQLALLAQEVEDDDIQKGIIGKEQVLFGRSPDNLSILIPLPDKIQIVRDQVFATSSGLSPETPGDDQQKMQAENATLTIKNGTQYSDLDSNTAVFLQSLGVNVHSANEIDETYWSTTIIDHTGNPYLVKYLVDLMRISERNIHSDFNPSSQVDVEIIIGNDWAEENPIP